MTISTDLYSIENGKTFEAFQWSGEPGEVAEWAAEFETEKSPYHGTVLLVGPYKVKPGSWVLRSSERGDIFPVAGDMFHNVYEKADTTDAA